jgi:large subunit ribosomal protein L5
MSRLKEKYLKEILPNLQKELGLSNSMQVPRIKKITLNMGVGEILQDKKAIEKAQSDLEKLSGQKPLITKAKKSVASFKVREGMPIGVKVTLRKNRMYEFLDRLINIALPRVRDFRGLSMKSFDGTGNYSLGIKEQTIFPEIDYDNVDKVRGLDITITTSATNNEETLALLNAFNFPIKQRAVKEEAVETAAPEAEETVEAVETAAPEAPEAEETVEAVETAAPEAPEAEETEETAAPEAPEAEETEETAAPEAPEAPEAEETEALEADNKEEK